MSDPRQKARAPFQLAVAGTLWLALFSLLFTLGAELGIWPGLPPGALRGTDLAAGLIAAVAILLVLLRSVGSRRRSREIRMG